MRSTFPQEPETSTTTPPPAPGRHESGQARPAAAGARPGAAPPAPAPHGRGGELLFEVPFRSEMRDSDLAVLAATLDLRTHLQPKMRPDPTSPGVARLDDFSGLYLERGSDDGQWRLQARTWGRPAPASVHRWHVLVAGVARRLDPTVRPPPPLPTATTDVAVAPVGVASNGRLSGLRRRLAGVR